MKGIRSTVAPLQEALLSSSTSQTGTPDSVKLSYYPKLVSARHIWKLFKGEFKDLCASSYMVVLWVVLVLFFFLTGQDLLFLHSLR